MTQSRQKENNKLIRIFLASRHTLFRAGLRRLLDKSNVGVVIGEAGDGPETLRQVTKSRPDILVLDHVLSGLDEREVLRRLGRRKNMRTVLMSAATTETDLSIAMQLGIGGIILKESSFDDFVECVRLVSTGATWVQRNAGVAANTSSIRKSSGEKTKQPFRITSREMEIISALAAGRRTKEIARDLSISTQTVKHHLTNLFNKTGTSSRLELITFAIAKGLVDNSQQQVESPMVEAGLEPAKSA